MSGPGPGTICRRTIPLAGWSNWSRDGGFVGLASVGYALGNGFRFELEGNYRQGHLGNTTVPFSTSGSVQTYGVMANALFDIDVGVPWIYPYIGGGVGYARTHLSQSATFAPASFPLISNHFDQTQGNFAFQAIGGLAFPIPACRACPSRQNTVSSAYRAARALPAIRSSAGLPAPVPVTLRPQHQFNHSFLLGVRYAFNVAPPVPVPPPQAAPAPAPARSYLVFFDWDKATLTDRARQVVKEAADNSTRVQYTRIEVNGYTDTSGTHQYNQGLSVRRAQAVQAELIKDGVPQAAIRIQGFGDTQLLVQTGPGVREPQNRRVEIVIR